VINPIKKYDNGLVQNLDNEEILKKNIKIIDNIIKKYISRDYYLYKVDQPVFMRDESYVKD
jgi:hypothetical protein